jgi:hypothetical protein
MLTARAAIACVGLGALATLVSGCGLSSLTSGIGGSVFGGQKSSSGQVASVSEDQLLQAAKADAGTTGSTETGISHGCPRFQVWSRDNNLTIYEAGRAGDGLAIRHRGEITKTARECQVSGNQVTVKYGFSGRVLLGPKGQAGNIALPVNVYVTDAKREKVAADQLTVAVDVAPDKPIGYFSAVRTVTFAVPEGARPGEFEVFVGFDRSVPGAG